MKSKVSRYDYFYTTQMVFIALNTITDTAIIVVKNNNNI